MYAGVHGLRRLVGEPAACELGMGVAERSIVSRGPFLFHESLVRYRHSDEELVNRYDGVKFRRAVEAGGGFFLIEARAGSPPGGVAMRVIAPGRMTKKIANAGETILRHLLAIDLDLGDFYGMARRDSVLAPIVRRFRGLRPVRYLGLFEALVTAITTQQVNLTFGGRTRARLVKRWGEKLKLGGEIHHVFPRPERLARARVATLKGMQFSERKAEYVVEVARAALAGELEGAIYQNLPLAEAVGRLTALRGVGRWSAEQALYRGLGRIEALPAGDLGVQKVVARYCFGKTRVDETLTREATQRWEPWGALAAAYLFAAWRAGIPSGDMEW